MFRNRKIVSLGKFWYYIVGFVTALKGGWLHTDPKRDEVLPLNDPSIKGGLAEDATDEEVRRYIRVMGERMKSSRKRKDAE